MFAGSISRILLNSYPKSLESLMSELSRSNDQDSVAAFSSITFAFSSFFSDISGFFP